MELELRRSEASRPWTYQLLDERQRQIASDLRSGARSSGAMLLNEVAPVVTVGRRTPATDLLLDEGALAARGVALAQVDRGGLATYHGPGQWVLFPVERLEHLTGDRRGVRRAVEGLLDAMLEVSREYEPRAEIRAGLETGVWSPRGKLGSVGVHVERGVLLHGLALNAFRTSDSFAGIRPCGGEPRVDFLLERPNEQEFATLGKRLISAVFRAFFAETPKLDLPGHERYIEYSSVGV